jgi:hypothetical protein
MLPVHKSRSLAFATLFAATLAATLLVGCKASEAPSSGFNSNRELMHKDKTTPFNLTYWNTKYNKHDYTEVYVAPVNMDYVMKQDFWEKFSTSNVGRDKEAIRQDIQAIGEYTRNAYIQAFTADPAKRFTVLDNADKVGPRTLILETAITQLVPSKPVLNAAGYVTWIPSAVGAAAAAATESPDTGKGYIAIEGRVRDGATRDVAGMFADRETPPAAIVDLKALTWWDPAKTVINDWATQLVALANRRPGEVVKDTPTFTLLVW